jgi:hypothetical protein
MNLNQVKQPASPIPALGLFEGLFLRRLNGRRASRYLIVIWQEEILVLDYEFVILAASQIFMPRSSVGEAGPGTARLTSNNWLAVAFVMELTGWTFETPNKVERCRQSFP